MGQAYFFAARENNRIIGVIGLVLRTLEHPKGREPISLWYICDLKIHPDYQGMHIIKRIFNFSFRKCFKISKKFYAISMNSNNNGSSNIVAFAKKFSSLKLEMQETLDFYLLEQDQIKHLEHLLREYFINYGFVSLPEIKDLILSSTNKPLEFLHLVKYKTEPMTKRNAQYMMCLPRPDTLNIKLKKFGFKPMASASIISNLKNFDWSFITSDEI